MMRLIVLEALLVCSVPKTTWPVSAASMAAWIVARSAHFADEDDVGVHTQGAANALLEVGHVHADLALVDRAFLVLVVVLDRVFQRDDVAVVVLVDEVDHPRQAGRLAGAGRAGDEQQAARPGDEPLDRLGHADLLEGQELARNAPQHHADVAALLEDGDAETVAVGELDGEVGPALFLEFLLAAVGRDALHQAGGVVLLQRLGVEAAQAAVVADHGRLADRDVQVAGLELDDRGQQLVDQNGIRSHECRPRRCASRRVQNEQSAGARGHRRGDVNGTGSDLFSAREKASDGQTIRIRIIPFLRAGSISWRKKCAKIPRRATKYRNAASPRQNAARSREKPTSRTHDPGRGFARPAFLSSRPRASPRSPR